MIFRREGSSITGVINNWNCYTSDQVLSCLYDTDRDGIGENFPDGASQTLYLNVNIPTSIPSGTTSTNFVRVALNSDVQTDSNLANNTDSDPTTVLQGVDLVLTKDDNIDDPTEETFNGNGSSTATYRITASNTSGSNANAPLTIVDTLPSGFKFTGTYSGANNGTNWVCNATDATGTIVVCTNSRGLNDGESTTLNLTANVLSSVEDMNTGVTGIQSINSATISSASNEINYNNNTATQTNKVDKPAPDLIIQKTDNNVNFVINGTPQQSDTYQNNYFIEVDNLTGTNVTATTGIITVTDYFPTGLTFVSAASAVTGGGWTCDTTLSALTAQETTDHPTAQGKFTCTNPGPFAPGQSSTIKVTVSVPTGTTSGTTVINKAKGLSGDQAGSKNVK